MPSVKSELLSFTQNHISIVATSTHKPRKQLYACVIALALTLGLTASASAQARTLTVLHTFTGGTDGANPQSELIRDSAGNLYGTTRDGGSTTLCGGFGCGTVFKIDSSGNETVLYRFTGGADGSVPLGGVIRDAAGNLYGTAAAGGASGWGTVFKLDKNGNETTLYTFTGFDDGGAPVGSLVRDAAGNLYGTTTAGGIFNCVQGGGSPSCGTVFKLDTSGTETVLYTFQGTTDGSIPFSGLALDGAGNLYGTASNGGHIDPNSSCDVFGCGTVFKIDTTGTFKVLYTFLGGKDGDEPQAPVTVDAAGNLYGTTYRDFNSNSTGCLSCGTIFKVNGAGKETVLYSFVGGNKAASPRTAKLLRGVGGVIWGTTPGGGGAFGNGVVYRVDPGGKETDLHRFTGGADGASPVSGVIRDPAGNFYGMTYNGGDLTCELGGGTGCGTVYKIAAVAP
jgi:uncharacterized repeat protein (TIGR03803 family)